MKVNRIPRILLIILLTVMGIVTLLGAVRLVGFVDYFELTLRSLLYLFGLLGNIALLIFVSITTRDLLKKKPLSKEAYVISIVLSLVALVVLVLFGYGLLKDILGIRCSGFFGSSASCTLSPLLLLSFYVLHPISLFIAGLVSAYGIYRQLLFRKRSSK